MNNTVLILIFVAFLAVIVIQDSEIGELKKDIIGLQESVVILNEESRGKFEVVSDSQVRLINELDTTITLVYDALIIRDERIEFLRREITSLEGRVDSLKAKVDSMRHDCDTYWDHYPVNELLYESYESKD